MQLTTNFGPILVFCICASGTIPIFAASSETINSAMSAILKVKTRLEKDYKETSSIAQIGVITQQISDLKDKIDSATSDCEEEAKVGPLKSEIASWKRIKKEDKNALPKAKDEFEREITHLLEQKKQKQINSSTFEKAIHGIILSNKSLEEMRPVKAKLIKKEIQTSEKKYEAALVRAKQCAKDKIEALTKTKDELIEKKETLQRKIVPIQRQYEDNVAALDHLMKEYLVQTALGLLIDGDDLKKTSPEACESIPLITPILGEFKTDHHRLQIILDLETPRPGLWAIFYTDKKEAARSYLPVCYLSQFLPNENEKTTTTGQLEEENANYFFERKLAYVFFKHYDETKLVINPESTATEKLKFYFEQQRLSRFAWFKNLGPQNFSLKPIKSADHGLFIKTPDKDLKKMDLNDTNLNLIRLTENLSKFANLEHRSKIKKILIQFIDQKEELEEFTKVRHPLWLVPKYITEWLTRFGGHKN